jgi:kinesin family protein C1
LKEAGDALENLETVFLTAVKTPRSPSKSPMKPLYLTKESHLTSFTGWDVDHRLNQVESQFKVIKEAMDNSLTDKKALENAVDLAKTRGIV